MIKLSVQNISGKIISFDVNPTTTFAEVEKLLYENENFKGDNYKFIYKGNLIDPSNDVESIKYDPSFYVRVAFHPASSSQSKFQKSQLRSGKYSVVDDEMMEKIETISALGYDPTEVKEALEKFDYDAEKAKNYIVYREDNEANQKLVDIFIENNNVALKIFQSYLSNVDPELAEKVGKDPIPMLIMMGIIRKRNIEDDFDFFSGLY